MQTEEQNSQLMVPSEEDIIKAELYTFLRFASGDIQEAISVLEHSRDVEDESLQLSLLKFAAVCYCRPFLKCRGANNRRFSLESDKYVPAGPARSLHEDLKNLRNEVFAHTDLKARAPELHCWPSKDGQVLMAVRFKTHHYPKLLKRRDDLLSLFEAVLTAVHEEFVKLELHFKQLYQ